jgi:secreted PhoX family phosphatase
MTRPLKLPTLADLLSSRLNRRDVLMHGGILAAVGLPGCGKAQDDRVAATSVPRIEASSEDRVIVPDGYRVDVVLRWGDPILPAATGLDLDGLRAGSLLAPGAGAAQAGAFGDHCDGIGVLRLGADRVVMCINHEMVSPDAIFPGWTAARATRSLGTFVEENPEAVAVMQAAVGVSIVELARSADGHWQSAPAGSLNRRITAATPMSFSGPASDHPWLGGAAAADLGACLGTLGNCAAGMTPWGTYLTAEENTNFFFGNAAAAQFDPAMEQAHRRFGMNLRDSSFRWEYVDRRFDTARAPAESFKFGWVVEIDPLDPNAPIKKRTALGRCKHEGATTVLTSDRRPVVYMGDDEVFEYFYKFVGDRRFNPDTPDANRDLLDQGTLYVARLHEDGSGEWLPLIWRESPELTSANGFQSQGDVLMRCREAADRVGATPLDRPEDVAVSPITGNVYLSCTQNLQRGSASTEYRGRILNPAPDAANPRPQNRSGHILELLEDGRDFAAETFRWNVFVLAGDPDSGRLHVSPPLAGGTDSADTYFSGLAGGAGLSALANPDNLGFDEHGNLWIVTDGQQPGNNNNGCFVCPTEGPERGAVRQFMSGPIGAEICGCEFSPDGQTLFLTVQHPGPGSPFGPGSSDWPDGGGRPPRSSLIAVSPSDRRGPFTG